MKQYYSIKAILACNFNLTFKNQYIDKINELQSFRNQIERFKC